jgi:hypothetical protein
MKTRQLAGVLACIPLFVAVCATPANATATSQKIGVPTYFDSSDTASWTALDGAGSGGVAIVNEDNGPLDGTSATVDSDLAARIQAAHKAGVKVLGYVDSGYLGTSPNNRKTRSGGTSEAAWMAQAESDVSSWYSLYGSDGIDGIFFDDGLSTCPSGTDYVNQYATLKGYVDKLDATAMVADNPGADVGQCYLTQDAADTFVDFEGSYSSYATWTPKPFELSADPGKFWNLVYSTSASQMTSALALSKTDNAGYVYATDLSLSDNPWGAIASYFPAEVTAVGASGSTGPSGSTGEVKSGIAGYCLDDRSDSASNGAVVTLAPCNNSAEQQWTVGTDGTLRINNLCLDVTYNYTANGSLVELYSCNGQSNQEWVPNSTGELVGSGSGRCLDDPQFFTDGHQEDIFDCNAGSNQKWTLP